MGVFNINSPIDEVIKSRRNGVKELLLGKRFSFRDEALLRSKLRKDYRRKTLEFNSFKNSNILKVQKGNVLLLNGSSLKEQVVFSIQLLYEALLFGVKGKAYLRYAAAILAIMVILNLASPALYEIDPNKWQILRVVSYAMGHK